MHCKNFTSPYCYHVLTQVVGMLSRWRTYLRPDVKHPHLEPFTEWEAAVIVQSQKEYGNNWLGKQDQTSTVLQ